MLQLSLLYKSNIVYVQHGTLPWLPGRLAFSVVLIVDEEGFTVPEGTPILIWKEELKRRFGILGIHCIDQWIHMKVAITIQSTWWAF